MSEKAVLHTLANAPCRAWSTVLLVAVAQQSAEHPCGTGYRPVGTAGAIEPSRTQALLGTAGSPVTVISWRAATCNRCKC